MGHRFQAFLFLVLCTVLTTAVLSQESREVHKSGPFSREGRLFVDTYKGTLEITTWDKAEIDIVARIEAEGSGRRSREDVQDTEVRINLSENSARVKTDYERVRHHNSFFGFLEFGSAPISNWKGSAPATGAEVMTFGSL